MNTKPTRLIDAATNQEVEATIHIGLAESDLLLIERIWSPHRARLLHEVRLRGLPRPQSIHWDWGNKASDLSFLATTAIGVFADSEWQAVMMTKTQPYVARYSPELGKPLVYVDYIEAAPWNWKIPAVSPIKRRLKPCGAVLMREAIEQSLREEFGGRVGLHALGQAEAFYELDCGMTRFGPDAKKEGLAYFEFTREQADRYLTGEQP